MQALPHDRRSISNWQRSARPANRPGQVTCSARVHNTTTYPLTPPPPPQIQRPPCRPHTQSSHITHVTPPVRLVYISAVSLIVITKGVGLLVSMLTRLSVRKLPFRLGKAKTHTLIQTHIDQKAPRYNEMLI